ncbi:RagB/SusD family nutrient uptake outer membrane protein [Winogradskyella sp. PC D3.3]
MKKYILILFTISTVFYGCSDILDTTPGDATTDANFPNSVDDLEQMVLGSYNSYPGRAIIEASSLISDDVRIAPTNTGQGAFLYNWTYTSTEDDFEAIWDALYTSINRANQVILNFDKVTPTTTEIDDYNRFIAEAYGMRAFSHFVLLQSFSADYSPTNLGVPYVTSLGVQQRPARDTAEDVMDGIKSDITEALNLMPSTASDVSRLTTNALKALRAKVALWEGDYATVISEADDVLAAVPIASATEFSNIWNDTSNAGVIFEIGRDATNAGDGLSGDLGGIYTRSSNSDIFFNPSDEIRGLYAAGDIRPSVYFTGSGSTAKIIKYATADGQPGLNDTKVFRAEDMLLMRAEAKVRSVPSDLVGAAADVSLLLTNRGLSATTFGATQSALDFIYSERRRELAYEGHRIYDAKRFGKDITRDAVDCINVLDCDLIDEDRFTYPIPQSEIFANPSIVQNPGYN